MPSKYHNRKCIFEGEKFDSIRERDRWIKLRDMEKDGVIHNLQRQVKFDLCVNGKKVCAYIADFVYHTQKGVEVVDAKGMKTPVYRLKKKLMLAVHGIEIKEV